MNKTNIEWTATVQPDGSTRPGYTSNPIKYRDRATGKSVWACVRKSPGCAHCYAADLATRYGRGGEFTAAEMAGYECYVDEKELRELLSVRRLPAGSKVFLGDMTDVFGEWVPFEFLDRVFAVMALRPDVVFQVLTKRPERMREYVAHWERSELVSMAVVATTVALPKQSEAGHTARIELARSLKKVAAELWPLPNVWLGTSVENQRWADVRLPELLATPAAVRFVSYEPALGPVDFRPWLGCEVCCAPLPCSCGFHEEPGLDWIIVGGESGPRARPFDVARARSTVAQCRAAGVAVFVKQMGANVISRNDAGWEGDDERAWPELTEHDDPGYAQYQGEPVRVRLKSRHGSEMGEWPEDLRVREWPR